LIKVLVKFFASSAEIIGERDISINLEAKSNIEDLFKKLARKYPQKFQSTIFDSNGSIKPSYRILLNEQNIEPQNSSKILLKDKDIIAFLPPIGGG